MLSSEEERGSVGGAPVGGAPVGEEEDRRPTPVRMAMDAGEGEEAKEGEEVRMILDPEDGREWVVQIVGRSTAGILPLRTVPLMDVTFSLPQNPQAPLRRATCQGEELESLTDSDLLSFFRASKPHRPPLETPPGSEGRGKKGRTRRTGA